ncbi:MAG: methyltransferase domain-containing protein [Marinilabiliales bacterium]|nr:methyltransferase domain-containing protein [Marinilabiliales bacterium]
MYQLTALTAYLENTYAGHLLDVATGEGDFLRLVLDAVASFDSATGLIGSKEHLQEVRNKLFPHKVDLVPGHVRKLPFEDNYFDFVMAANTLHRFDNPVKSLQSMMRVLVSGGRIMVHETIADGLNPAQQAYQDYHNLKADIETAKGNLHRYNYLQEEIHLILADAGIEVERAMLAADEPPLLNSREKIWQFSQRIDDLVSLAGDLPQRNSYEARSWDLKEKIRAVGFQRPPQLTLIAYKA